MLWQAVEAMCGGPCYWCAQGKVWVGVLRRPVAALGGLAPWTTLDHFTQGKNAGWVLMTRGSRELGRSCCEPPACCEPWCTAGNQLALAS